jgi:bifunctional N-acetylglucosamine-1-phosphate-uridyltransferase/glucosamine-1-phosphate-acetyltransferase GlmU-like protein
MRLALGKPLLRYVLDGLSFIPPADTVIVVGYQKDKIPDTFSGYAFAEQTEQLGTGHAVLSAAPRLRDFDGSVLICCGDMPLLTSKTYQALASAHMEADNDCTILTSVSREALPYGRIIRNETGAFLRLVEDKDCTEEEKKIRELNTGVYVFRSRLLFPALSELKNNNVQGEYYLTDVPSILRERGAKIGICSLALGNEIIGVNTQKQLDQVEAILRQRG